MGVHMIQYLWVFVSVVVGGQSILSVGTPLFIVWVFYDFIVFFCSSIIVLQTAVRYNEFDLLIKKSIREISLIAKEAHIYAKMKQIYLSSDRDLPFSKRIHIIQKAKDCYCQGVFESLTTG